MKDCCENVVEWPRGRLDFSAGCVVMGVLNVTPDSFSDGGQFLDVDRAVERAVQAVEMVLVRGLEETQTYFNRKILNTKEVGV